MRGGPSEFRRPFTKLLAWLSASMWPGSVLPSPGPEASFEVKGPEGGTDLGNSDADISCLPPPRSTCHSHGEVTSGDEEGTVTDSRSEAEKRL